MTEKRFGYGAGINWQEDIIIDYETEKSYDFYEVGKLLNALNEENKQLKERNERQAKQLDNLYILIEKQDWKTLKGLIQEFQECEEQLQREWKCYE